MQFIRQTPSLQYSFPTPCNAKKLKELDIYVACKIAGLLAAAALEVPPHRIVAPGRCTRNEAKARHVAMYIAHVAAGIPLLAVGKYFLRDRTTVAHACRRIEDCRDEPAFDKMIADLGQIARKSLRLDQEIEV